MDSKENRKKLRLRLNQPLDVRVSSIGSPLVYELVTDDISMGGFFLAFSAPSRFPFLSSSILEVFLQLPSGDQLFFNGMMARIVHSPESEGEKRGGIAIRIVQIDPLVKETLQHFIENYSQDDSPYTSESMAGAA